MSKVAPEDKAIEMFKKFLDYCDKKEISHTYMVLLAMHERAIEQAQKRYPTP